jgi:hypothetical protein
MLGAASDEQSASSKNRFTALAQRVVFESLQPYAADVRSLLTAAES